MFNFLKSAVDDASANQRAKISAIYIVLLAASALVWIWALIALAGRPTLLGTAFLAYVLGLRHAVDADHIATIDNVVRKLMQDGKRPYSVGLFFSLGHSLSIALAVAAIAATAFALQGRFAEFKEIGSIIGTGASAFFPAHHRRHQSRHPARRLEKFSAGAPRRAGRGARAEPAAVRPRPARPHLPAAVPHGVA